MIYKQPAVFRPALAAIMALAIAACGVGGQASPSAAQRTAPSAPSAQAGTSASPSSEGWDQVGAAAKREGHLSLVGQGGTGIEQALTDGFKKLYPEIQVDFSGGTGGEIAAKLLTERRAGKFDVDVIVHGTTTILTDLIPAGAIDPLQPALIGPNDHDPSKWRDGKFDFADDAGKYDLMFLGGVKVPLIYNQSMVSPGELKSYKDLLDPKWKGKLAMFDPRIAGPALATATFWYTTPSLGKSYIQQLFTQNLLLTKDNRQVTDWVGQGQYPIAIATDESFAIDFRNRGVPIGILGGDALTEGTYLTAGWGSVALINRAAHPNAARLYLDWLLSKEGQQPPAQAMGYASRRQDTSTAGLSEWAIPKPGVSYQDNAREPYVKIKNEVVDYLKEVIPG